jgi:hypothetical protein
MGCANRNEGVAVMQGVSCLSLSFASRQHPTIIGRFPLSLCYNPPKPVVSTFNMWRPYHQYGGVYLDSISQDWVISKVCTNQLLEHKQIHPFSLTSSEKTLQRRSGFHANLFIGRWGSNGISIDRSWAVNSCLFPLYFMADMSRHGHIVGWVLGGSCLKNRQKILSRVSIGIGRGNIPGWWDHRSFDNHQWSYAGSWKGENCGGTCSGRPTRGGKD